MVEYCLNMSAPQAKRVLGGKRQTLRDSPLAQYFSARVFQKYHLSEAPIAEAFEEKTIDEKKLQAEMMMRFYFKGLGDSVGKVNSGCNLLLHPKLAPERKPSIIVGIFEQLDLAQKLYSSIPFDELGGNGIFQPLFAAREALGELSRKVRLYAASEVQRRETFERIDKLQLVFCEFGYAYRLSIEYLLAQINEKEMFGVKIIDIHGKYWGRVKSIC